MTCSRSLHCQPSRLSGLLGALPYLGGCRLVTNQSDWIILYGWEQIEIVRGDFPSHISRSDESIYWWPLFIWECRLNVMIGIDELLGRVLGRGGVPSDQGPGTSSLASFSASSPGPLVGNSINLCFPHSLVCPYSLVVL